MPQRVSAGRSRAEELQQAAVEASAKLRSRQLQSKIVQSMREVDPQKDKSDKAYDELMEEVSAVKTNMAEALLQIAKDLHIPDCLSATTLWKTYSRFMKI